MLYSSLVTTRFKEHMHQGFVVRFNSVRPFIVRVNLVKEVKKERDEIRKDTKKCKKEKPQVPLSGSLPLSGTQEITGGPLRGKMAAEGKNRADALTAERILYLEALTKTLAQLPKELKTAAQVHKGQKIGRGGEIPGDWEKRRPQLGEPEARRLRKEGEEHFTKVPLSGTLPLSGMASSSGKRLKTMATKRKEKEPEQPHSSRFLSRKHEKHFRVVQDRRLLMERKVGMIPNFAPQFGEQVLGNDWGKLATYPAPANIAVVKEFYTNAKKIGDYPAENYLGYVRGHAIRYDPDSINNFLDTVWAGEQCQFALCMEEGADFEDVERVLCIPGGHFQRNRSGSVVNIRRTDLNPLAKYWMAFSHANIQPCSHVSDLTLSRALFIYCAIRNLNVNIGQVIADEISVCANTLNNKAPLGHPSLITHLCKIAGVDTSAPPFERPRKAIDEEMRDMYMSLIGAQLQSIHRGQVATAEMIVGMYDTPPAHKWTMDEFHNVVAWPEEPVQREEAEAAEASVREMEEDEADDDDDAFEDA
ncbi:hypothetical protein LR48_Vigan04g092600 [Vigna angularis]|uniref:Putative plant transposon protein domain-containing protein n=1 Tax=Phaseolus angularis TaxID=3914 RepID=A0A0L9UD91_PHAAN|nr:hypothetical protein LR48_Vigan04g092600 [Vigna angularis]